MTVAVRSMVSRDSSNQGGQRWIKRTVRKTRPDISQSQQRAVGIVSVKREAERLWYVAGIYRRQT